MKESEQGLLDKYEVRHKDTGKPINGACFVLRPDKDPAAIAALQTYAIVTHNKALAEDINAWLRSLE